MLVGDKCEVKEKFEEKEERRLASLQIKLLVAGLFSLPVFFISMFFKEEFSYGNWILLPASLPVKRTVSAWPSK